MKYSKNTPFISGSVEGKCRDQSFDQMTDCDCISLDSQDNNNQQGQGNLLTLKDARGVQKCPVVRRLSVISLRVMLWSQKFLTLSINIVTRSHFLTILTDFSEIEPRPIKNQDFLEAKITKSILFQLLHN